MKADRKIKCVVWDLDNTLWHGTLLENDVLELKDEAPGIIEALDGRGILQSVASRNDFGSAMQKIDDFGLKDYFLYPQIHWNSKAESIKEIARLLNIGTDTIAFVDDQPFERDEVRFSVPDVLCIDAADLASLPDMPEMNPRFITEDSKKRRLMYLSDLSRKKIEEEFSGPKEEFLASLGMVFTIRPAREEDLKRAEELTVRTNQLNTTGYTYSYEDLDHFRGSDRHKLLIAGLDDRYGAYGRIGLTLLECSGEAWLIKLLLMSCRVMSRGVGSVMINYLRNEARKRNVRLFAEMLPNDRNRMMYVTYKFAGFREREKRGDMVIFENDLADIQAYPDYVKIVINE